MKTTRAIFRLLLCVVAATVIRVSPQVLTAGQVDAVKDRLAEAAQLSWEIGTRAEALLELDSPSYAVFSPDTLPPPQIIPDSVSSLIQPVLDIASSIVYNRSWSSNNNNNNNASGPQPLMQDGSAADPASIGVAVLLANWTGQGYYDNLDFAGAATDQLDFLYQSVPRTSDGAISHRMSEVQLWSDFVYMVPPFLAYYGVVTRDKSKLVDAYNQIRLYRNYLRDTNASNLWKHVLLGSSGIDDGHWSTGNGWAAAGMLRVLATMLRSEFAGSLIKQQVDLTSWVSEIHQGMYQYLDNTCIFRNYPDDNSTFYDASSTAFLASTVYRISVLRGDHSHVSYAEASRKVISGGGNSTSTAAVTQHITPDGWLTPVVNPHEYGLEGSHSAEAQAFVLQMQAAWRDWVAAGSKVVPTNEAAPTVRKIPEVMMVLTVVAVVMMMMMT